MPVARGTGIAPVISQEEQEREQNKTNSTMPVARGTGIAPVISQEEQEREQNKTNSTMPVAGGAGIAPVKSREEGIKLYIASVQGFNGSPDIRLLSKWGLSHVQEDRGAHSIVTKEGSDVYSWQDY